MFLQKTISDRIKNPFFAQTSNDGIMLLEYDEIQYFLRGNPYITSGYRSYLSFRKCLSRYIPVLLFYLFYSDTSLYISYFETNTHKCHCHLFI